MMIEIPRGMIPDGLQNFFEPSHCTQCYMCRLLTITAELKRVLKPTGTLWWNHGDSYSTGDVRGFMEANDSKRLYSNVKGRLGGGGITGKPKKSMLLQPYRLGVKMIDEQGWILRNQIIWHKPNCMPSSVKDRFTVDFEPILFFTKSKKYWFEQQFEPSKDPEADIKRILHDRQKKGAAKMGNAGAAGTWARRKNATPENWRLNVSQGRSKRTVWKISTKPYPDAHFAVFPPELVEAPIKAGCPLMICRKCVKAREKIFDRELSFHGGSGKTGNVPKGTWHGKEQQISGAYDIRMGHKIRLTEKGHTDCGCNAGWKPGIVLDPFAGSGTTLSVAQQLGRRFVGIELNPEYIKLARQRLQHLKT